MMYFKNLVVALYAWLTCWRVDKPVIERRLRFLEDACPERLKRQLPYKLLSSAYKKRLR